MLYIVGLGPGPGYATEAALRAIREADCVFYEDYTGPLDLETLRRAAAREPVRLARRDLEEESGRRILSVCGRGGGPSSSRRATRRLPRLTTPWWRWRGLGASPSRSYPAFR